MNTFEVDHNDDDDYDKIIGSTEEFLNLLPYQINHKHTLDDDMMTRNIHEEETQLMPSSL